MKTENSTKSERYLPDPEIIELYWARDERAIDETDKKYRQYLHRIAYNIVHDDLDCEECLNDTYLGTWNRIPPTRPNAFQLFLSKIMRNIAIDRYRKNSAKKNIPVDFAGMKKAAALKSGCLCASLQGISAGYFQFFRQIGFFSSDREVYI